MKSRFAMLPCAILLHGCSGGGTQDTSHLLTPVLSPATIQGQISEFQMPGVFAVAYENEGEISTVHTYYVVLDDDSDTFVTGLLDNSKIDPTGTLINPFPGNPNVLISDIEVRSDLSKGTHTGTMTMHFCRDTQCKSPIGNSTLPYSVTVNADPAVALQTLGPNPVLNGAFAGGSLMFQMTFTGTLNTSESLYARVTDASGNLQPAAQIPMFHTNLYASLLVPVPAVAPNQPMNGTLGIEVCDNALCSEVIGSISVPYSLQVFTPLPGFINEADYKTGDPRPTVTLDDLSAPAMDGQGNLFVFENQMGVYRIDTQGNVTKVSDLYNAPAFTVDPAGDVYISNSNDIIRIDPAGTQTTVLDGSCCGDYPGPLTVGTDGSGYAMSGGSVLKFDGKGNATIVAGVADQYGSQDGQGTAARFSGQNSAIGLAPGGNVLVADLLDVRKMTPQYDVSTVAGNAAESGTADGTGSNARFTDIKAAAIAPDGTLYAVDSFYAIRSVTPAGVVSTPINGMLFANGSTTPFLTGVAVSPDGTTLILTTQESAYSTRLSP